MQSFHYLATLLIVFKHLVQMLTDRVAPSMNTRLFVTFGFCLRFTLLLTWDLEWLTRLAETGAFPQISHIIWHPPT
ncbi:hypothetical protein D3C75_711970 [compost metagenome]